MIAAYTKTTAMTVTTTITRPDHDCNLHIAKTVTTIVTRPDHDCNLDIAMTATTILTRTDHDCNLDHNHKCDHHQSRPCLQPWHILPWLQLWHPPNQDMTAILPITLTLTTTVTRPEHDCSLNYNKVHRNNHMTISMTMTRKRTTWTKPWTWQI